MLITDNSIPVGSCQDDRWTINEKNKGILVHTRIWRRNTEQKKTPHLYQKHKHTEKPVTQTEIDLQDFSFPQVESAENERDHFCVDVLGVATGDTGKLV